MELFVVILDEVQGSVWFSAWPPCPQHGDWSCMILEIPSNPRCSIIHCFCGSIRVNVAPNHGDTVTVSMPLTPTFKEFRGDYQENVLHWEGGGHGTGFLGQWSKPQDAGIQETFVNILRRRVWIWGDPMWSQELESVILMGPFHFEIFYGSMNSSSGRSDFDFKMNNGKGNWINFI